MAEGTSFNLEQYVREKVDSGEFSSPEEFTREAVRVYHRLETQQAELRTEIQKRVAEADRGEIGPLDMERIKAEGRKRLHGPD
jgi:antitoxin ParD1/3/4